MRISLRVQLSFSFSHGDCRSLAVIAQVRLKKNRPTPVMITSASSSESFPVVILYDHLDSIGKAMSTYAQLTQEIETDFEPDLRIWRLDVALSPEFSREANRDIEAAEVIIMTVHGNEPCPPQFLHWKAGTGEHDGVPHRAIIAIMESSRQETLPGMETWSTVLRGVGTEIHPELFVCDVPGEGSRSPFGAELELQEALPA